MWIEFFSHPYLDLLRPPKNQNNPRLRGKKRGLWTARRPAGRSACACSHIPSVSVAPSSCPLCPAASSPSTGQRNRMDWYRTLVPPSHRPCRCTNETKKHCYVVVGRPGCYIVFSFKKPLLETSRKILFFDKYLNMWVI